MSDAAKEAAAALITLMVTSYGVVRMWSVVRDWFGKWASP